MSDKSDKAFGNAMQKMATALGQLDESMKESIRTTLKRIVAFNSLIEGDVIVVNAPGGLAATTAVVYDVHEADWSRAYRVRALLSNGQCITVRSAQFVRIDIRCK